MFSKAFLQNSSNSLVALGVPLFQFEYCYHINETVSAILNEEWRSRPEVPTRFNPAYTVLILDHNHKFLHMFQIRETSVNPAQFYKTLF